MNLFLPALAYVTIVCRIDILTCFLILISFYTLTNSLVVFFFRLAQPSLHKELPSTPPTSLPPLNVSPPSFGFSHFTTSRSRASDVTQTPDPGRMSGVKPPQALRTQKSTSFEFATRARMVEKASGTNRGPRPVITVSAPPKSQIQTSERNQDPGETSKTASENSAATAPSDSRSRRTLRKPLILPFTHRKTEAQKVTTQTSPKLPAVAHPVVNRTPPLPAQMKFPMPPKGSQPTRPSQDSLQGSQQRRARNSGVTEETTGSSPRRETFPTIGKPHAPGDQALKGAEESTSPTQTFLPLPEGASPTRSRFSTGNGPVGTIGRAAGSTMTKSTKPPPLRLSMRRSSRSPSPAGTPPTAPLPDLPPEAHVPPSPGRDAQSPTALSPGPYSPAPRSPTTATVTVPTIPSTSTIGSRRSNPSIRQRGGLRSSLGSTSGRSTPTARAEAGDKTKVKDRDEATGTPEISHYIPSFVHQHHSRRSSKDLENNRSNEPDTPRTRGRIDTSAVQQHLTGDPVGLRVWHESQIRTLRELHEAEKAELLRRIEALERDMRKKDREIRGLRWLVLHAADQNGDTTHDASRLASLSNTQRRKRSESQASGFSLSSSTTSHAVDVAQNSLAAYSPRSSTEEGLYEVQASISDLFSYTDSPPALPELKPSPSFKTRSKRSNTLPSKSPHAAGLKALAAVKQARRTSSPVLPTLSGSPLPASRSSKTTASTGLGIDYPSIPSLSDAASRGSINSTGSSAMTMPSLTATNTTSSSLSAIPESPNRDIEMNRNPSADQDKARRDIDERQGPRALKPLSGTPSSSSLAYHNNLKLGESPSISSILDSPETDSFDDVLRKLRSFGGTSS